MGHAEECSICGAFRPRAVSAKKVYGLLPDPRPAAELRLRVMSCFLDPELVGYRLFVATRVTEFTSDGFPSQAARSGRGIRSGSGRSWFGRSRNAPPEAHEAGMRAQIVRAAMVLAVVALLSGGGVASMYGVLGTARKPTGTAADPHPTAIPGVSQAPGTRRPPTAPQEGPGTLDAAPVSATLPLGARASSAPATALPVPLPIPVSEGQPDDAKGVLTVSPLFLDLAGESDGSVEVRAENGPVAWRAAAQGPLQVEPSSGELRAGQTMTVRVHVSRRPDERGGGTITFRPGAVRPGAVHVRVTWRQDAPPPGNSPSPTPTGSASETPSTPPETQRPESPHPTSGTQRPESPQPSPPPPSTPSPATPPSGSTPEPTPTPAERSSGSTSPSVGPTSTG